ncbi:hypothetical protein [Limnohabitans sp.]
MDQHFLANAGLVRVIADAQLDTAGQYNEADVKAKLPNTLGPFLGECIRQTYGGQWVQDTQFGWQDKINEGASVFPINKVAKHLANEEGYLVLVHFTKISLMIHFASQ